jgi:hypothetical protein
MFDVVGVQLNFVEVFLRGAAAGLLIFHTIHLLRPAPHAVARFTLAAFTLSVLAYLFCSLPPEPHRSVR